MSKTRTAQLGYSRAYRAPGGFWLENDTSMPGWTVAARFIEGGPEPVIAELRLIPGRVAHGPGVREVRGFGPRWDATAAVPPGGVSRELLKQVPLSALAGAALSAWQFSGPAVSVDRALTIPHPKRPGRKGHPAWFLAGVALLYVSAIEAGYREPNTKVKERLGELGQPLSIHTGRGLVRKARERGYLSRPAQLRQVGGRLTPEAIWVLKQAGVRHHLLSDASGKGGLTNGEH
jgi:hypothetical protein